MQRSYVNRFGPARSNRALIQGLRRFARSRNHQPFSTTQWDAWPDRPAWSATYIKRFGSWRAALSHVRLHAKAHRYSNDEVLSAMAAAHNSLRRPLRPADLLRHCPLSRTPIIRIWGNSTNACKLLNLYFAGHITRAELFTTKPTTRRRNSGASLTLRWRILKRDNYRCVICGRSPATTPNLELEVDHIHPVSRGGTDHESNLRTLCRDCNQGKKAQ